MGAAGRPRGGAESLHELGDGEPAVVGAARVRRAARRHPRHRQVAGPHRPVLAGGGARLLRRDRVGGAAAVVQRPRGPERHLVLRDDAVAGREPEAAVARGHDPVGRRGRHVPRLRLSTAASSRSASSSTGTTTTWRTTCSDARRRPRRTRSRRPGSGNTCATASTATGITGAGRSGRTSTARSTARATGAGWRSICAGTPRATCGRRRGTRSSASTPAPTTTPSTRRRAGMTSSGSSITG